MPLDVMAAAGLASASLAWWLGAALLAVRQSRSQRGSGLASTRLTEQVGVSVIVPVASPAPDLGACVQSLCAMEYSPFEILLVAAAGDLPAVAAIEREASTAGLVRTLIVDRMDSPNPKVALVAPAVRDARYDLMLFTDDNAISPAGRVQSHLRRLSEGCSLVSAVTVGVRPTGFWGQVDAAVMNGYVSRLQLAGEHVGFAGVMGKSMLVRRSDVERSGGLLTTGRTLCEDAALQKQIERTGGRTGLSAEPMTQVIGMRSAEQVWARHRRWSFCRWTHVPGVFVAEVLLSAAVACAAGAVAAAAVGGAWWAGAVAIAAALYAIEVAFLTTMRWPAGPLYPLVWLAREAFVLPLCLAAVAGGSVAWRNRRFSLRGEAGS